MARGIAGQPSITLDDRLAATGGRPSGFDYLRIILASSVILFHSLDLTTGHSVADDDFHGVLRPILSLILPMFFALSGFLVCGSLERSKTLISFLGLRAIRLLPALTVETVLCAVVLGLAFTTLPHREYLTSAGFAHYFLNIVGDIHFYLPGVFKNNPITCVNYQLWTVPWELRCYLAISVLAIIGLAKRKSLLFPAVILLNLALFLHHVTVRHAANLSHIVPGLPLIECFLYGICLYSLRSRIVWNRWIAAGCFLCLMLLGSPFCYKWGYQLVGLPAAYLTVFLGLLEPKKLRIVSSGDYSYGIYLYGYPVQQAVIELLGHPVMMSWYMNFIISWSLAALLAVGSWHLIEKHAARLRPSLFSFEKRFLNATASVNLGVPRANSSNAGTKAQNQGAPETRDA